MKKGIAITYAPATVVSGYSAFQSFIEEKEMLLEGSARRRSWPLSEDESFRQDIVNGVESFICHKERHIQGRDLYLCLERCFSMKAEAVALAIKAKTADHQEIERIERVPDPTSKTGFVRKGTSEMIIDIFNKLIYDFQIREPLERAFPDEERSKRESHVVLEEVHRWCKIQLQRFTSSGQQQSASHYQ